VSKTHKDLERRRVSGKKAKSHQPPTVRVCKRVKVEINLLSWWAERKKKKGKKRKAH